MVLSEAVLAYRAADYERALPLFDGYLIQHPTDKVGYSNRAATLLGLGRAEEALRDAQKCIDLDQFWPKGYRRYADALCALDRKKEALEMLIDARKVVGPSEEAEKLITPQIMQLNKELGNYINGLDFFIRSRRETFCAVCHAFEADCSGVEFIRCSRCDSVHYCCEAHMKEDSSHFDVCEELAKMRNMTRMRDLVSLRVEYPDESQEELLRFVGEFLGPTGPLASWPLRATVPFRKDHQLEDLYSWDKWFGMKDQRRVVAAWEEDIPTTKEAPKEALTALFKCVYTDELTDALTVFHALQFMQLLLPLREKATVDGILSLHIVGAEPTVEFAQRKLFHTMMRSFLCANDDVQLHVSFVGPLLPAPDDTPATSDDFFVFRGNYQEFLLSESYSKPDVLVSFFPGLHVPTYPWLPVVAHAIAKNIPFIFTSNSDDDYQLSKKVTSPPGMYGMMVNMMMDSPNPFASLKRSQKRAAINQVHLRNKYILGFIGGTLGPLVLPMLEGTGDGLKEQVIAHLKKTGSYVDFDKLHADLMELLAAGMLIEPRPPEDFNDFDIFEGLFSCPKRSSDGRRWCTIL